VVSTFAAVRVIWLWLLPVSVESPLDARQIVNVISPIVLGLLPVVGTTVFVLMCSDRIRREWEHAAATDYLTGLPNRRTLNQEGVRMFDAARQAKAALTVAMLDVDHFKLINDNFGHETGDAALCHLTRVLKEAAGATAVLARMGGEEFVVVLPGVEGEAARHYMDELRRQVLVNPLRLDGQVVSMSISIGVSWRGEADVNFRSVLRRADRAVYQAKELGRNSVVIVTPENDLASATLRATAAPT